MQIGLAAFSSISPGFGDSIPITTFNTSYLFRINDESHVSNVDSTGLNGTGNIHIGLNFEYLEVALMS
jgi:hypothetical protein